MLNKKKYLIIDSRPYGFFSIFLHTIDCLKWCEMNGYEPYIRWGPGRANPNYFREGEEKASALSHPKYVLDKNNFSNEKKTKNNTRPCLYSEKEGENAWDYYFESINKTKIEEILQSDYEIADIFICGELDFDISNKFLIRNIHSYDKLKLWDVYKTEPSHRKEVNEVISRYVKIKKDIQEKADKFFDKKRVNDHKIIGVHIRGTDKRYEHPFKFLTIEHYIKQIENILEKEEKSKIYIASDNNESIIKLADRFGKENIICYPSFRMSSYFEPSPICLHINNDTRKRKHGEEVLIETYLLSKCDYIIGTDSNVVAAASYFNPNSELIFLDRINGVSRG